MTLPTIIDSHVHLWPESAANHEAHAWMSEGVSLAKEHLLRDYYEAANQNSENPSGPKVRGVIYVETDRRCEEPGNQALHHWAFQPIEEIRFLRSIVEEQYGKRDSDILLGLVPWAPVDRGVAVFVNWLEHAEQVAGPETWKRVRGFRALLQAIADREQFETLVFSQDFISVLKSFRDEGRNFSFDVGIDQHSGGVWQLEAFANVIERVHANVAEQNKVIFILNHLCKPDMTQAPRKPQEDDFQRWCDCIKRFSQFPNVYMKLSGAFSELSTDRVQASSQEITERMKPWLDQLFSCFPPNRIMFGSDWPVCNIRGPAGEDSWMVWKDVVQDAMERRGFSEDQKQNVWSNTAKEAYRLRF